MFRAYVWPQEVEEAHFLRYESLSSASVCASLSPRGCHSVLCLHHSTLTHHCPWGYLRAQLSN